MDLWNVAALWKGALCVITSLPIRILLSDLEQIRETRHVRYNERKLRHVKAPNESRATSIGNAGYSIQRVSTSLQVSSFEFLPGDDKTNNIDLSILHNNLILWHISHLPRLININRKWITRQNYGDWIRLTSWEGYMCKALLRVSNLKWIEKHIAEYFLHRITNF